MAYLGARKRTTRQASSQAVNRRRSEGGPRAWFASIDWNSVRFRTVAVLFFVVWGALWVRAGYVQLWEGPFLAERARRQHMAAETVAMPRGMITIATATSSPAAWSAVPYTRIRASSRT